MEYKTDLCRKYFQGQVYYDEGTPVEPGDLFESEGLLTTDSNTVCDLFAIELKDEEGSISTCLELDEAIKLRDELNAFIDNLNVER
jgi:hypothetical protein